MRANYKLERKVGVVNYKYISGLYITIKVWDINNGKIEVTFFLSYPDRKLPMEIGISRLCGIFCFSFYISGMCYIKHVNAESLIPE